MGTVMFCAGDFELVTSKGHRPEELAASALTHLEKLVLNHSCMDSEGFP
jgi:hypothetical protein